MLEARLHYKGPAPRTFVEADTIINSLMDSDPARTITEDTMVNLRIKGYTGPIPTTKADFNALMEAWKNGVGAPAAARPAAPAA